MRAALLVPPFAAQPQRAVARAARQRAAEVDLEAVRLPRRHRLVPLCELDGSERHVAGQHVGGGRAVRLGARREGAVDAEEEHRLAGHVARVVEEAAAQRAAAGERERPADWVGGDEEGRELGCRLGDSEPQASDHAAALGRREGGREPPRRRVLEDQRRRERLRRARRLQRVAQLDRAERVEPRLHQRHVRVDRVAQRAADQLEDRAHRQRRAHRLALQRERAVVGALIAGSGALVAPRAFDAPAARLRRALQPTAERRAEASGGGRRRGVGAAAEGDGDVAGGVRPRAAHEDKAAAVGACRTEGGGLDGLRRQRERPLERAL